MKARITLVAILVLAAAAAVLAWNRLPRDAVAGEGTLTIHFTCDTAGRLEPCGCFTGQHGGLTRLRTWLNGRKDKGPVLKVDAGGAIAGGADYDIIQHGYLTRAYAAMDFSALNMGGREAALPAKSLAALSKASAVPLLSASLVDEGNRQGVLPPYRVVEMGGTRIGILGVISPDSVPTPGEGLAVLGLNEAINRHLPELAAKSDVLVLLAFAKESEMRRLARDYFEFSVIIGGDVAGPSRDIIRENDSLIVSTTNQARTVGTLTAKIAGEKRKRLTEPSYQIRLLEDTIPEAADMHALVHEYLGEIRTTPLAVDDPHAVDPDAIPGVSPRATFVGSVSCQSCHPKAYEVWKKTGHGHAFSTLVKKGADADPHCIKCHTVGFGQPSGYRRPMGVDSLVDVGCESCHGPASEHVDKHLHGKTTAFKFRPLGPGDCKSCHHGEFSRPFDWDKFWPGIAHGKESTMGK